MLCGVLRLCPVGEIYVVIKKKKKNVEDLKLTEGSVFKASIAWDLPCCPIYL